MTLRAQAAAGFSVPVPEHVVAEPSVKSAALGPTMVMPVKVRAAVPLFVRVTGCGAEGLPAAWLAKVRLVGLMPRTAAVAVPVTGRLTGLSAALSVSVKVAVRAGGVMEAGVNTTLIVQVAPTATVAGRLPQLLVCEKSAAFAPPKAMLVIMSAPVPVALLTVTGIAADAVL